MDKRIGLLVGLTALFAMGSAHAQSSCGIRTVLTPIEATNTTTGHRFEVWVSPGISWEAADVCARRPENGVGILGHLATITSSGEDAFAHGLITGTRAGEYWVGGRQTPTLASPEPYGGWSWVNGEGPIETPNLGGQPLGSYQKWLAGEPNNVVRAGCDPLVCYPAENFLAIGFGGSIQGWNDEGALGNIKGFIVEYDIPRTAACTGIASTSCNTIDGQKLIFPAASIPENATINFTAYEFTDPRVVNGKCTGAAGTSRRLTLFKQADGFGPGVELQIPSYLCGSPKFVVVAVDSSQLDIRTGTVFVKNDTTETVLKSNLYRCFDPILGRPPVFPAEDRFSKDPQYQDVVVWQSTNPGDMAESGNMGTYPFDGAATEITNGCGSSTGKSRGASYFVVGLHIDFNPGSDYEGSGANPAQNYQQFVALTQYKLMLLQQSVAAARSAGSITNPNGQAMASQVQNAINNLNAGDPAAALKSMTQFLKKVNTSTYKFPPSVTFNYNGDHLMRGENIAFTLRVKVVPYKPVP